MKKVFIFIFLICNFFLYADIAEWDRKHIKEQMDAIPLKQFSTKYLKTKFNKTNSAAKGNFFCSFEIKDNVLYLNNKKFTEEDFQEMKDSLDPLKVTPSVLLAFWLYNFSKKTTLPNVYFYYTWWSINTGWNPDFINFPVLVGTKESRHKNTLTFIEAYSLRNNHWKKLSNQIITNDTPWEMKENLLFWRGYVSDLKWKFTSNIIDGITKTYSPRIFLYLLSLQKPNLIDARLVSVNENIRENIRNELGLDDFIENIPRVSIIEHLNYKYQIVADGFHCSNPGYSWRLLSNCCVFKIDSDLFQWFYIGLKPWIHYIPIKKDLSDLIEKIQWTMVNDNAAKTIAENGKYFALKYLTLDSIEERALMFLNIYADYQQKADAMQ